MYARRTEPIKMGKVRVDVASARWEPWLLSTLLFVEKATEACQGMILA